MCRYNIFMKVFGSSYSNLEDIRHPFDKAVAKSERKGRQFFKDSRPEKSGKEWALLLKFLDEED